MNSYEQKQQNRRDRLISASHAADGRANQAYSASREATAGIVFGQPILVGHHSERRHRRAIERSDNAMRRSVEESDRAVELARRAEAVGTGGISSDDPDALVKLRAELAECEESQKRMKDANKAIRGGKTPEKQILALVGLGFSEQSAQSLLRGDHCGRVGFASYQLSNNNANMTRIKKRIQELEARRSRESVEVETEGYTYREDVEENRVMFEFDGKPEKEVRDLLSRFAFKWSPNRNAWVRQLTNAGIYAGKQVREALAKLKAAE
ncbi:DUF3560 domain-containing protein [Pseudomonas protegens]|uniref:DUF3560 domain-containing protein n=1 Tax=Pseudomonas protegens TaxID=380021 RepID=UPI0023EAA7D3|nr:DUF3560 domain-containing protein [Pseudomonas protegens]MDF4211170.1 DUF3560 domain-containing protein [Pseudomonas protegens]